MGKEKIKFHERDSDIKKGRQALVLINDDIHTFDYVIHALVEICAHSPGQAEQCALITHFKGKCEISKGTSGKLKAQKSALIGRGLKVIID